MANQNHITHLPFEPSRRNHLFKQDFRSVPWLFDFVQRWWWATAAYYTHRTYGDENLLIHAVQTWEHIKTLWADDIWFSLIESYDCQISEEDGQRGSIPTKGFPIGEREPAKKVQHMDTENNS